MVDMDEIHSTQNPLRMQVIPDAEIIPAVNQQQTPGADDVRLIIHIIIPPEGEDEHLLPIFFQKTFGEGDVVRYPADIGFISVNQHANAHWIPLYDESYARAPNPSRR